MNHRYTPRSAHSTRFTPATLFALSLFAAACSSPNPMPQDSATDTALTGDAVDDTPTAGDTMRAGPVTCSGDTSTAPNTFCIEFGEMATEAAARAHCSGPMVSGMFATGTCRTPDRVGICFIPSQTLIGAVYYYAPMTAQQAMDACNGAGGVFSNP